MCGPFATRVVEVTRESVGYYIGDHSLLKTVCPYVAIVIETKTWFFKREVMKKTWKLVCSREWQSKRSKCRVPGEKANTYKVSVSSVRGSSECHVCVCVPIIETVSWQ